MIFFRAHVQALECQIAYLKERLADAEQEKRELLDRLLVKNNVAPIAEPVTRSVSAPDLLTPFGIVDAEVQDAYKESWLRDEMQHIISQLGIDEGTARSYAEQEYVIQHQMI